jgi:hypothetical protein
MLLPAVCGALPRSQIKSDGLNVLQGWTQLKAFNEHLLVNFAGTAATLLALQVRRHGLAVPLRLPCACGCRQEWLWGWHAACDCCRLGRSAAALPCMRA